MSDHPGDHRSAETGYASSSQARIGSGSGDNRRPSFSRQAMHPAQAMFSTGREREQSVGAWSLSSVGTGDGRGTPSSSVLRSGSRRVAKGGAAGRSGLAGGSSTKRRRDKHSLALRSIREFLKGRTCYDCLPVSFRLVVLDTKLVVKPALEIMWQAGIVSAPLWQSTSDATATAEPFAPLAGTARSATTEDDVSRRSSNDASAVAAVAASTNQSVSPTSQAPHSLQSMNNPISPSPSVTPSDAQQSRHTGKDAGPTTSLGSSKTGFAGMFTVNDIIHLIQYYYQNSSYDNAAQDVERFRLEMLREIEQSLHVPPPPLLSIDPMRSIFEACRLLMKTHARRLPLLDHDEQTGMDVVVSVLTQYRVLKFIAMNCRETAGLRRSIRSLGIGTYITSFRTGGMTRSMTMSSAVSSSRRSSNAAHSAMSPPETSSAAAAASHVKATDQEAQPSSPPQEDTASARRGSSPSEPLATATLDTTVFDAVHIFSELGISGIPILDEDGYVVDLYETVDVIDLVRSSAYQSLDLTIRQALSRRSKDFSGVMTCSPDDSLATIFALLRVRRVHRILILEPEVSAQDPSREQVYGNVLDIEQDKALHAGVANDTGAFGDIRASVAGQSSADSSRKGQQKAQKDDANLGPLSDIPRRARGKLVGILCLSDIMRYIIGDAATVPASHAPGLRTNRGWPATAEGSTATSSVDHAEQTAVPAFGSTLRPRLGSGESASSSADDARETVLDALGDPLSGGGSSTEGGTTTGASMQPPASRFDPNDMPPTIEEHPGGEAGTPPDVIAPVLPSEDQTPTQEKADIVGSPPRTGGRN